jgi:hypothetical protein
VGGNTSCSGSGTRAKSGTDVKILKIFSPKNLGKSNWRLRLKTKLNLEKKFDYNIDL